MIDNRDILFDQLVEIANKNEKFIFLCNDIDVFSLNNFKKKYPNRVVNVGVAEQNLINIAAGLSSEGYIPIVYGILPFLIYRCFEQIKFNIDSMMLKILIIGIGTGHSFSWDGPTHYGVTDIALLKSLPNFIIANPIERRSIDDSIKKFLSVKNKSMFIRLEKGIFKSINVSSCAKNGFRYIKKKEIKKNLIITSGYLTSLYNNSEVVEKSDIIDLVFLNEINQKELIKISKNYYKIFIIDENYRSSSIIDIIYPALLKLNSKDIKVHIPKNNQELFYADRKAILEKYKLNPKQIIRLLNK